jgi:hypothetical protein
MDDMICSACRFDSIYPEGMKGRNTSSAEM